MEHGILIREYREADQKQVMGLILPIQQDEYNIAITIEDQPDLHKIPSFYQVDKGNFWVAEKEGTIIGTIALLDFGQNRLALRKMFVHKDYRGPKWGTARRLLTEAVEWSEEHLAEGIWLGTTSSFKAAHRFYEKNDFKEIERSSLPEDFPLVFVDNVFYRYTI